MKRIFMIVILVLVISGCATIPQQESNTYVYKTDFYGITGQFVYKGYEIEIISDPPGAKIEWSNEYIGITPLYQKFDGSVGNLITTIVKAYPISEGQYTQIKVMPGNQPYPKRIYFNMYLKPAPAEYNINMY